MRPVPVWLALSSLVAACDQSFVPPPLPPPPPPAVTSIAVGPDSSRLVVGDSLPLTAVLRDSAGDTLTGRLVTWTTDHPDIAFVLPDGLVITQDSGRVRIIASVGTVAESATVTVVPVVFMTGAAGARHSCVVGNNHRASCWGSEAEGQLGDSTSASTQEQPTPVPVYAGAIFATLTAGDAHTCALGLNAMAYCWGANDAGQLGRGASPGITARPALITGGTSFTSLAAGGGHTCGVSTGGLVLCWGHNESGELGDGSRQSRSTPVVAAAGASFALLAVGGAHTCALTTAGVAWCWGADSSGQRGDSTLSPDPDALATPTAGGFTFTAVAAGGNHTCALASGGTAYCWGSNGRGESGSGLPDTVLTVPAPVSGGLAFTSLVTGAEFSCGITSDSLAYCWGANESGQLGDGSQSDRPMPVAVSGGRHFGELQAGAHHTCGITGGFVAYCWGDGTAGQLGQVIPPAHSLVPLKVSGQS